MLSTGVRLAATSLVWVARYGQWRAVYGIAGRVGLLVGSSSPQAVLSVPLALISRVLGFFAVVVMLGAAATCSIAVYWFFAGLPGGKSSFWGYAHLVSTGIRVALTGFGIFGWSPFSAFPAGAANFCGLLHGTSCLWAYANLCSRGSRAFCSTPDVLERPGSSRYSSLS